MKNVFLFFSVLFFIISCTKESSPTATPTDNLIGSWHITEFYSENGNISGSIQGGIPLSATYTATGTEYNAQLDFSNNPKEVISKGSLTIAYSYNILGVEQTNENNISLPFESATWNLEDTTSLDLQALNGEKIEFKILHIDNNTLALKTAIEDMTSITEDLLNEANDFIDNISISGEIYITLTK